MKSINFDELLREGWSKKFTEFYLNIVKSEQLNNCFDHEYVNWAHSHGFLAENASAYGLNKNNLNKYLSDFDYYKSWPLNSWTRIWVNDKLTLKYMLANTNFDFIMPKYYFYSTPSGLRSLIDNPYTNGKFDDFVKLLIEEREFACKPCNGTASVGFVKMSFYNDKFFINENSVTRNEIEEFIVSHPNYIFTEYIHPAEDYCKYSKQIHTLRIVTLNETGNTSSIVGGYLRLPNKNNGEANYTVLNSNEINKFNLLVGVNFETGEYGNAKKVFINKVEDTEIHPDTQEKICGRIENYQQLKKIILSISERFNTLEWLGFDIGITDNGFKLMEVNTHPGIKYMQIFAPLFINMHVKDYFCRKIHEIDRLSVLEKHGRNGILR